MAFARLTTVGNQLVAVIIAAVLPLVGVAVYVWWEAAGESRALAIEFLDATAGQVDRELRQLRRQSDWVLSNLAKRDAIRQLQPSACAQQMALTREVHPAFLGVTLWNRAGQLICTSIAPRPGVPDPPPHRPSLEAGFSAAGLYFSDVFLGQITGLPLAAVTMPVRDDNGQTVGLLSLPISLPYFDRLLQELEISPVLAVGILDRSGTYVARIPETEKWRGKPSVGTPVTDAALRAAKGDVEVPGVDGIQRVYVFREVPETGWHVLVGAPAESLFAAQRASRAQGAVAIALILAASLALAFALGRRLIAPLESLAATADTVAAGDAHARARVRGSPEVERVAQQFNRMLDVNASNETTLRDANRRLRDLSSRLLRAEEAERRRIARELHDQVGQALTALELELQALRRSGNADKVRIERILQISGQVLDDVRNLALDLRPAQLDDLGLAAALRWHLDRYVQPRGIDVRLEFSVRTERLSPDIETACFRIAQEALTNVLRHADARSVRVTLQEDAGDLVMTVGNDGTLFDPAVAQARSSSGLRNMHDRATLAGGSFQIRAGADGGAEAIARFPLAKAQA